MRLHGLVLVCIATVSVSGWAAQPRATAPAPRSSASESSSG